MKKKIIIISIIIVLIITSIILYSRFIGIKGLVVHEYNIINEKVPENFNAFKIIHFSDLHYGSTINKKELDKIITTINEYEPDIIVFTGDLLSNKKINDNELINSLNKLQANIGMYYVTSKKDQDHTLAILNKTDFIKIDDINELIYNKDGNTPINLVGYKTTTLEETEYFTITLSHNPNNIDKIKSDVLLSGMTHGGQVKLPFIGGIIKEEKSNYYKENYYLINNTDLYISNGLGTNKYPFRLFSKPSINLYRLYNK